MHRKLAVALIFMVLPVAVTHAQVSGSQSKVSKEPSSPPSQLVNDEPAPEPFKEDWTKISLADSGLEKQGFAGALMTKGDLPEGCTREEFRVQWRPNDPIDLYVIRPMGVDKPPVGIFLLNYSFDTKIFQDDYWCRQSKQNGLAIVGFGSALSWQRFHSPRPMKQWFVSELQEALATSTHDVQMVMNYLQTRSDLDLTHIGMYGQGSGGAVAVLAAAADPRITALDITDPWGDWPDWLKGSKQVPEDERSNYLKPEFIQKVTNLDPVGYLPQLKINSLRIQQVMSDAVTPLEAKDKIAGAAPKPGDVVRYPDSAAQHKAVVTGGITEWLAQQFRPGTQMAGNVQ